MAIIVREISSFPLTQTPQDVDVFGVDRSTGQNVKARMEDLVGPTGPTPDITIGMEWLFCISKHIKPCGF